MANPSAPSHSTVDSCLRSPCDSLAGHVEYLSLSLSGLVILVMMLACRKHNWRRLACPPCTSPMLEGSGWVWREGVGVRFTCYQRSQRGKASHSSSTCASPRSSAYAFIVLASEGDKKENVPTLFTGCFVVVVRVLPHKKIHERFLGILR